MIQEWVWGHFLPKELSAFAYNETWAWEVYPLSKKETLEKWYTRYDEETKAYDEPGYVPLHISQYKSDIVGKELADENTEKLLSSIVVCEKSKKPFRIIRHLFS